MTIKIVFPWQVQKSITEDLEEYLGDLPPQSQEFYDQLEALAQSAEDGEITQDEFEDQLGKLISAALIGLYALGAGRPPETFTTQDGIVIGSMQASMLGQVTGLAGDIYSGRYKAKEEGGKGHSLAARLFLWAAFAAGVVLLGYLMTGPMDDLLMWVYDPTKDHCDQCRGLHGTIKTRREWLDLAIDQGIYPRSWNLECKGIYCGCNLVEVAQQ